MISRRQEYAILIALVLVGGLLRFYALDQYPPGLYRDEAYNGLDALLVLEGEWPIFFEANNGREPLYIYLVALGVDFLGRTALAIRVVSAALGSLTIVASYLLARPLFSSRVGLLTAAITAGTFWMVNLSRIGFRAVALPLFLALAFWQLWTGIKNQKPQHFLLAGILWGLSFYTYLSARFTVLLVLFFALYLILRHKSLVNRRQTSIFLIAALFTFLPLGLYFLSNWELTVDRTYQVSIFNPRINHGDFWGTLAGNVGGGLSMFNLRGDFIPRHNLPLRPIFDPLMGLFFLAGLLLSIRRFGERAEHAFLVIWLGSMLLPTLFAEGAPHFLRSVGILPAVLVFPALGLEKAWRFLESRDQRRVAVWGTLAVLGIGIAWTASDYFLKHAPSEAVYYNFESGAVQMAAQMNDFLPADPTSNHIVYLAKRFWDNFPSMPFLVQPDPRLLVLNGETPPQPRDQQTMLILWPFEDNRETLGLLPRDALISIQEGAMERGDLETEARLLYVTYLAIPGDSVPEELGERFGESIMLVDARTQFDGENLVLRLLWRANQKQVEDYIVFVHVLREGLLIAQADGPPALGYYPTNIWRAGDIVFDERRVELPEIAAENQLQIRLGLYILETSERLPVFDAQGKPLGDSLVLDIP